MPPGKSSFLDKVLGRIGRLDAQGLQTVVERLARERTFLETLFNTIEDGVLVVDEDGSILYLNQAVTRLLGMQSTEVEGEPIQKFLGELDWKRLLSFDAQGGKRVVRQEFEVFYPRPRFIRLYAAPLDGEKSGKNGMALILHDATEARQKTFEAIETERIQALTLLAASVAHEIGNPLNALHIHLQLMERELTKLSRLATPPTSRKGARAVTSMPAESFEDLSSYTKRMGQYLQVARGEIERLDSIVCQFLEAIRPSAPQMVMGDLNHVVRLTMDLITPEFENRGLEVRERLSLNLPAVPHDANQMKQVLVNLTRNAMQAMTKGGRVVLQTGETSDGVWVSVADNGGGIPQDQINRIFEPFFTTKNKGTGLGLMIVRRIVQDHGGRIEIDSQVGRGTTFRIWLPRHERAPRLLEDATR